MLRAFALKAILFGLLFSWASKRKVTRAAAADRNARRVGGQIAEALHKSNSNPAATIGKQSHWIPAFAGMTSGRGNAAANPFA